MLEIIGHIASILNAGMLIWMLVDLYKVRKSIRELTQHHRNEAIFDQMMERGAPISISLSDIIDKLDDINDEDWDDEEDELW